MTDEPTAGVAEPCRDCRAPLVPGQRYCLYCGARRPDARMEFMDVLVQDFARPGVPVPVVAAAPPPPPPARHSGVNGWLREHTPVLGLTGLILGTLLIGLLIGHWATGGGDAAAPAKAAAPQVIRVDAGGGAATTPAAQSAADDRAKTSDDKRESSSKRTHDDGATEKAKAPANAVSADSLGSGEAKEKAIEKAAKKGQPISTGDGELPPTDDKAPASGTEFETIG